MKKLLFLICALFMVGVSQAQTPQTQPQQKVWKVGDVYNVNGKKGVVFTVSPDGQHGVIISLKQTKAASWYSAKSWAASLATGWRMATQHELLLIFAVKDVLNDVLYWEKSAPIYSYYWTPNEYDSEEAWRIRMTDGEIDYRPKKNTGYYVRAVSSF